MCNELKGEEERMEKYQVKSNSKDQGKETLSGTDLVTFIVPGPQS